MRERLKVYNEQTAPLIDFYKALVGENLSYIEIDGSGAVDAIQAAIASELGSLS